MSQMCSKRGISRGMIDIHHDGPSIGVDVLLSTWRESRKVELTNVPVTRFF